MNENPDGSLQRQLASLRPQWRAWLRLRHRSLQPVHEDILQTTVADLLQYQLRHPDAVLTDKDVRSIGFTILKRRAADQYRSQVLTWADESVLENIQSPDPSTDPEQVTNYARLLRAVLALLAKLDAPTRELLVRDGPLTDAERQRRSRLRADLRRQLAYQYHIDLNQVL
jgi:DNA-directed RNA polymerase specialized sigma24 family protein